MLRYNFNFATEVWLKNMNETNLSVREIQEQDIESLSNYWFNADNDFLITMGVDLAKMRTRSEWEAMLMEQINSTVENKKSYCVIWLLNNKTVGHSNINKIKIGEEAYMHLHLWNSDSRKKGLGIEFIKLTLPYFFEKFKLQNLFCEPYALNPAPNKAIEKVGFEFVKKYTTTPGFINFEQEVS